MNLTGTEVRVGMTAAANVSSVNTTGSVTIGTPVAALVYTLPPTLAYSLRLEIADGETLNIDTATGEVTGTDPGVLQVETATVIAAAGATTAGDATVIVTAANLAGSPLTVSVPLLLTDNTASLVATKIREALLPISAIVDKFTVGGTGSDITLTAKIAIANDPTLNISIANGTCAGITAAPTSANTLPGILATKAYRISGATWDQTDFEGQPLPYAGDVCSVFVKGISGNCDISFNTYSIRIIGAGGILMFSEQGDIGMSEVTASFASNGTDSYLTIDIHAA